MATDAQMAEQSSLFSTLTSFFLPTAHAEEAAPEPKDEQPEGAEGDDKEEEEDAGKEEGGDEEEEEEEEEPEDCEAAECREPASHFKHCAEKVEAGKGWHGEDCVEELFHLMHCVDACAAPKLFKKLA